jgi:hypothetical protein
MGKAEKIETRPDQARAALAEAIADRDERVRDAKLAGEAVASASDLVEQASARHELAKATLSATRSDLVARALATASTGSAAGPPLSARQARTELADADDAIEAATAALTACTASLSDCEDDARRAGSRVEAASVTVLAGEVDRLLAEAAAINDTLEAKLAAIDFVTSLMPFGSPERQRIALTRPTLPPGVEPPDRRGHPAVAAWREAQAALQKSADAPLP